MKNTVKIQNQRPFYPKRKNRGFALVATLSLMVLLAILAVGMLSLSAVTLRGSGQANAQTEARANARVALMLAIGELQRQTGADTRVTAPASIVDETYPQVLGVWRSWEGTDHEANGRPKIPDYASKDESEAKGGRFLDWLVSSAKTIAEQDPDKIPRIEHAPSLVSNKADNNGATVPLLAGGSLQSGDKRQIHVVPNKLSDSGRYAWWISGENQKAVLSQPYKPRTDDAAGRVELGQSHSVPNPEVFGLTALLTDPEPHHPDAGAAKPGRKAVSRDTMALINNGNAAEPQQKFHDLSAYSIGLLTNTATGGWRKDMSLLTERWDAIYSSYPGGKLPLFRYTPTAGATTLVPKPTVANYKPVQTNLYPWSNYSVILGNETPSTLHAASASWASLRSFATTYKNFSYSSGVAESPFLWDVISRQGTALTGQKMFDYKHTQRLYPLIARFQFLVYSKAIEDPARLGQSPKKYQLNLLFAPIFTLWNPYNIRLTIDNPGCPTSGVVIGARRAYPGALAVVSKTTYPNPDTVPGNQYKLLSPGNFQYLDVTGNHSNQYDTYLKENIDRFNPGQTRANSWINGASGTFGANLPFGKIIFEPGEAIMFSPDGNVPTGFGGATAYGMEKGYRPAEAKGRVVNVASNLTADRSYWFLLRTDKFTQPFKNRAPGVGFSLSYGIETGAAYLNLPLYSGVANEYNNITSITSGDRAANYWPQSEVDEVGYSIGELASGSWIPLFSMNQGPRMTIGTPPGTAQNRPTKGVLQSDPLASIILTDPAWNDSKSHPANGTFDMSYHSLRLGSTLTPNLSDSKGFIATGYQSGDGLSRLITHEIPVRPMASLVELLSWNPRGQNPYPPYQMNLIGNSDATPLIPMDNIVPPTLTPGTVETNLMHDDAYCSNHLLFDDWFLSSIAPEPETSKTIDTVYTEFLKGERELVNRSYHPISADSKVSDEVATKRVGEVITSNDGWLKVASRFEVEGMFNVNSTSVEAWKALLGHARSLDKIAMHGADGLVEVNTSGKHAVTRGAVATDVEAGTGKGFGGQFNNASEYNGYRSLTDDQITDLAENVVEQVRLRGPFLSLSEFVNRQLVTNKDLALAGALQTALDNLEEDPMKVLRDPKNSLSDKTMSPADPKYKDKLAGVGYEFKEAAEGGSTYGAPGWIRQADILRPIAPIISVRDDTFTIRAYGDSMDQGGNVIAKAWCEAVVNRTRDFSDKSDAADTIDPPVNPMNTTYGRRYEIVSFRWLSADEV